MNITCTASSAFNAVPFDPSTLSAAKPDTCETGFPPAKDALELSSQEKDDIAQLVRLGGGSQAKIEDFTVVKGTNGDDIINVSNAGEGGLNITVNDKTTSYTAEQAAKLIIASGDGHDRIKVDKEVTANLLISGGRGFDNIESGSGHDTIVDNLDQNYIDGGAGDDTIIAKGVNLQDPPTLSMVYGREVNGNVINGGAGNDYIEGSNYNDVLAGLHDNDMIFAHDGDDVILAGQGRNFVDAGAGNDHIENQGERGILLGGAGNDYIEAWQPAAAIIDRQGENIIEASVSVDYLLASPESKVTIHKTPKTL
ncbi:MAG: calcium-binding protein [bacterium]|nr:calcium-binding protein [bacterium]